MSDTGSESVWFATALELVRPACEVNCNALACAGRMIGRKDEEGCYG